MNKDNLNKMADYFEHGPKGPFNMNQYRCCALGHSIRVLEDRIGPDFWNDWNSSWVQGASYRLFGFVEESNAGQFLFSSKWINDPAACAARFRYVALHGDAPSKDQWNRFQSVPKVVEAEEEVVETEELACV